MDGGGWWWWYVLVGDGRYESHTAAAMMEELEVGETGESVGWLGRVASRAAERNSFSRGMRV
jgi:hypothetical protein